MKSPIRYIHRIAAVIALLIILSFFISSLVVELLGDKEAILEVKTYIFLPGLAADPLDDADWIKWF